MFALRLLPAAALALVVWPSTPRIDQVRVVLDSPVTRAAFAELDRSHDRMIDDTVALAEIPAPTLHEDARGAAFATMLRRAGLANVTRDAAGNVVGVWPGRVHEAAVALAAHLDTVFPAGTNVRVKRAGTRLSGPGVGDNARSAAVLVAIASALRAADVWTDRDILFIGTVGEEGAGDLRGVRHLFTKSAEGRRIGAFIAVDGAGPGSAIVDAAVGVRRYRVRFTGPGGHGASSFGIVNPAFALAAAIQKLSHLVLPPESRSTFNVGVIGGGTAVNAVPADVWTDVDLRSESPQGLEALDRQFTSAMRAAADEENRARSTALGRIAVRLQVTGSRPSGRSDPASPLLAAADAVVRAAGLEPVHEAASTDANIPISLGIPAIAIESGGDGGRAHTTDEWIDVSKPASLRGEQIATALVLAMAGLR